MTISTHDYSAQLVSTVRSIDVPAHDVQMPARTVYSQDFESFADTASPVDTPDAWTLTATDLPGAKVTAFGYGAAAHAGRGAMAYDLGTRVASTSTTRQYNISRFIYDLTPGLTYSVGVWIRPNFAGTVFMSAYGYSNSGGVAVKKTSTPGTMMRLVTERFVPAKTQAIVSMGFTLDSPQTGILGYFDDVSVVENAWVDQIPDHYADPATYPLSIVDGSVRLDEGAQPYMGIELTVSRPSAAIYNQMNPTNSPRVTLTATETNIGLPGTVRTFNGLVRSSQVSHVDDTVTLKIASDDVTLQDDRLIANAADTSNYARAGSVRSIVAYMVKHASGRTLAAGTTDADFTPIYSVTNQIENPSFLNNLANTTTFGTIGTNGSLTQKTDGGAPGAGNGYARLVYGTDATTAGGIRITKTGVTAGLAYSAGVYVRTNKSGGQPTRIRIAWISSSGSVISSNTFSAPNVNVVFAWNRLTISGAVAPAGAATVYVDTWAPNGTNWASGNVLDIDGAMLVEGDYLPEYFDGSTTATDTYAYGWNGTSGGSTSNRAAAYERSTDSLVWNPGESAWEFLEPILDQAGLRLFCDEKRVWQLVDNDFNPPGLVTMASDFNIYGANDSIDRSATAIDGSPLFIDAAVVEYSWLDRKGSPRTAFDSFALPGATSPFKFSVNRPYPGPGAAKYAVTRNNGRGHALDLTARQDWSVTPSQQISTTLPSQSAIDGPVGTPLYPSDDLFPSDDLVPTGDITPPSNDLPQVGYVSAVQWSIGADDMSVFTRGLIQIPTASWAYEAAGLSWDSLPAGSSWANG
ncbi:MULTISPECIES: hypothetical protein [unclassified Frondihabitans]|uniref:hypothetical protein n=1 Tax=unclassified Frondihabitans TaxID=2626248 RepID=UPI000F4EC010|nr:MULTISPECIES: hypothetical protein [unclassified Frondihabitans]RPE75195.1 hypothetical protein EDF37_2799 [Frondihabitans sp. PhB153]RPF04437.1 hypothetical protein EDF39_2867 [Frondihabitans sp. PhB161]